MTASTASTLSLVLARLPADRADRALGDFNCALFECRCHGVVPSVEVAEQGDGGHDLDNLPVVEVLLQFLEVVCGRLVRNERGTVAKAQRGTLRRREERACLELPDRP